LASPNGEAFSFLAAAAVVVAATVVAAAVVVAAVAVTAAAAAEQQNQDDDPPAVISTKTIVAHKEYLQLNIRGIAAHSKIFPSIKKVQVVLL